MRTAQQHVRLNARLQRRAARAANRSVHRRPHRHAGQRAADVRRKAQRRQAQQVVAGAARAAGRPGFASARRQAARVSLQQILLQIPAVLQNVKIKAQQRWWMPRQNLRVAAKQTGTSM